MSDGHCSLQFSNALKEDTIFWRAGGEVGDMAPLAP